MSIGNRIKNLFTVDYDEDYEDDYYEDDYDEVVEEPIRPSRRESRRNARAEARTEARTQTAPKTRRSAPVEETYEEEPVKKSRFSRSSKKNTNVTPISRPRYEVSVMNPQQYENTKDIIDALLEGKAVVLNLEGIRVDLAQRIVDSVSGGTYAINGHLQRISGQIYLLTPASVDITGDMSDLIANSVNSSNETEHTTFRQFSQNSPRY